LAPKQGPRTDGRILFERRGPDENFCDRQKRVARERVDQVIGLLRQNLVEPSLEEIGRKVGCSPFHLSRTFPRAGMTISQYLRKLRMERAAELSIRQIQRHRSALEVVILLSAISARLLSIMAAAPASTLANSFPKS